jgi:hypothetical protein
MTKGIMKKAIGFYEPVREGWEVTIGKGEYMVCERQVEAEILSRLAIIEHLLRKKLMARR